MTNQEKWVINIHDEDGWSNANEFKTEQEAIDYVKEDFEGFFLEETGLEYKSDVDDKVFYVGQKESFIPSVDAVSILDEVAVNAFDEVGDVANGYLRHVKNSDINSLEERLNNVLMEWMKETNNLPTFWLVKNVEKVII